MQKMIPALHTDSHATRQGRRDATDGGTAERARNAQTSRLYRPTP